MANTPNFTDPQFIDASAPGGLNQAFGAVSGSLASLASGAWAVPGLIDPENAGYGFSGMVTTANLQLPWGLVTSGGVVVHAHGTQTGLDTQLYAVDFTSLVPGTGSITAYLAATPTQIGQNPVPIPGPPPGHPAYDPTFVPTVGYTTTVDSVALSAVTGGIDNFNTFELFRTTLTAGQTSITGYNSQGWIRAALRGARPASGVGAGGNLNNAQAQVVLTAVNGGITSTLPSTSIGGGLTYIFSNPTSGTWTIATTGSDKIEGFAASGSSVVIPSSGSMSVWGNALSGVWQVLSSTPQPGRLIRIQIFNVSGAYTYTPAPGMSFCLAYIQGAGGGSGGINGTTSPQVALSGGGMCGALCVGTYTAAQIGASKPVTVGQGGLGGASGSNTQGGTGGTSSLGSLGIASGGLGSMGFGPTNGPFAAPGAGAGITSPAVASGGNMTNAPGIMGALSIGGDTFGTSGGPGAVGGAGAPSPIFGGSGPGAGGNGAAIAGTVATTVGNAGSDGTVVIYEYS
jgi:hypothetical protein